MAGFLCSHLSGSSTTYLGIDLSETQVGRVLPATCALACLLADHAAFALVDMMMVAMSLDAQQIQLAKRTSVILRRPCSLAQKNWSQHRAIPRVRRPLRRKRDARLHEVSEGQLILRCFVAVYYLSLAAINSRGAVCQYQAVCRALSNCISSALSSEFVFFLLVCARVPSILQDGSPLLISIPEEAEEGTSKNWLGGSTMYWSTHITNLISLPPKEECQMFPSLAWSHWDSPGHFSVEWYELTLKQLGFELIIKYKDVREFFGQTEVMYYLLFKVFRPL